MSARDFDRERSERIPVPHRGVPRPPKAELSRFDRRRSLVHVRNILDQHFRKKVS